jgi:hypothetical protein
MNQRRFRKMSELGSDSPDADFRIIFGVADRLLLRITYDLGISHQVLACCVGDAQLIFSMSGIFQLLSKNAFSGPKNRNHENQLFPAGVLIQFDSWPARAFGPK